MPPRGVRTLYHQQHHTHGATLDRKKVAPRASPCGRFENLVAVALAPYGRAPLAAPLNWAPSAGAPGALAPGRLFNWGEGAALRSGVPPPAGGGYGATPRALAPPSAHSSRGVAGAVRPSLGSVTQKGRSKAPPLRTTSCLPATNETLSRFRRRANGPAGASAPTILSHYRCSFTVPTMAPKVPPLSSSAPVRAKATSVINSRSRFRSAVHTR